MTGFPNVSLKVQVNRFNHSLTFSLKEKSFYRNGTSSIDDGILFFLALGNETVNKNSRKVFSCFQLNSNQFVDKVVPDAVVLVAVDVVVVVDAEPAEHRDLGPAPRLLPLTRLVNHLMDNIHPDARIFIIKAAAHYALRSMFSSVMPCVYCSLQMLCRHRSRRGDRDDGGSETRGGRVPGPGIMRPLRGSAPPDIRLRLQARLL